MRAPDVGGLRGWQSNDLHYVNSLFYGTHNIHRNARICSWALTARSLFAKSITANIQRVLERVSTLVSNSLQYFIFYPINKGLRAQNNTVRGTVGATIPPYTAIKNRPYPPLPIVFIEGYITKIFLTFRSQT